jgi:hypothetical protein
MEKNIMTYNIKESLSKLSEIMNEVETLINSNESEQKVIDLIKEASNLFEATNEQIQALNLSIDELKALN